MIIIITLLQSQFFILRTNNRKGLMVVSRGAGLPFKTRTGSVKDSLVVQFVKSIYWVLHQYIT